MISQKNQLNKKNIKHQKKVYECLVCGKKVISESKSNIKPCSCSNGMYVENTCYKVGE